MQRHRCYVTLQPDQKRRIGENRKYENIPYAYTGQKIMFFSYLLIYLTLYTAIF
jgi:hypothetical protein